jgi:glycerol-3-phosphate dehydrogenase (NAD(P)+)
LKTKIVILGAGVMGSALAVPAAYHPHNEVTLVGSPLDDAIIDSIQSSRHHPTLNVALTEQICALRLDQLDADTLRQAEVIVIGVSSPGIAWVVQLLEKTNARPAILALVTKGLVENNESSKAPLTYADALNANLSNPSGQLVGIGGPCIARELALHQPTRVTFASRNKQHAQFLRTLLQTPYYRVTTHQDIVAVEACAALKNFLAIGVSAMLTAHPLDDSYAKNPVAALFNQAVLELLILSRWIAANEKPGTEGGQASGDVAFNLAGMGDLHVTVGGGRNSRLGTLLGQGRRLSDLLQSDLKGVTVEGVDTGKRLAPGFYAACDSGELTITDLPLTCVILDSILKDVEFKFNFDTFPDLSVLTPAEINLRCNHRYLEWTVFYFSNKA